MHKGPRSASQPTKGKSLLAEAKEGEQPPVLWTLPQKLTLSLVQSTEAAHGPSIPPQSLNITAALLTPPTPPQLPQVPPTRRHSSAVSGQDSSLQTQTPAFEDLSESHRHPAIGYSQEDVLAFKYEIDPNAKIRLRKVLERMKKDGCSIVDIGRFLAETYDNKDRDLGGLVTRLLARRLSYSTIALTAMETVGLLTSDDEIRAVNQRHSLSAASRYYSRPPPPEAFDTNLHGHPTSAWSPLLSPYGPYPAPESEATLARGRRHPAAEANWDPARLQHFTPRRQLPVVLSRSHPAMEANWNPARLPGSTSREPFPAEGPPVLQPTSFDRVRRGFYDPEQDGPLG
ncbi:hypothetical protein FQN57_003496 [Myotisia sp. PD_48]|nr:hypothetical protein FQN57_003496 [Myotisia sp. PD_48]